MHAAVVAIALYRLGAASVVRSCRHRRCDRRHYSQAQRHLVPETELWLIFATDDNVLAFFEQQTCRAACCIFKMATRLNIHCVENDASATMMRRAAGCRFRSHGQAPACRHARSPCRFKVMTQLPFYLQVRLPGTSPQAEADHMRKTPANFSVERASGRVACPLHMIHHA